MERARISKPLFRRFYNSLAALRAWLGGRRVIKIYHKFLFLPKHSHQYHCIIYISISHFQAFEQGFLKFFNIFSYEARCVITYKKLSGEYPNTYISTRISYYSNYSCVLSCRSIIKWYIFYHSVSCQYIGFCYCTIRTL